MNIEYIKREFIPPEISTELCRLHDVLTNDNSTDTDRDWARERIGTIHDLFINKESVGMYSQLPAVFLKDEEI